MSVMNPATAHLLYRFSPAASRNLIFSIKQTGVPLAWLLLALIAPGIALAWGWRWALAPVLGTSFVMLILLQTVRARWDDDRSTRLAAGYSYLAGMRVLWQPPALRWLAIASFCYSFLQLCLGSFLVTMMVEEAAYSLVEAGLLLSLTQAVGVTGRIFWGWCADRLGNGLAILQRLNIVMIACCIAAALITPRWPAVALIALFAAFGASAVGWNGIFLAEVARRSPHGMISIAVGGAMMWNFGGILAGPATFATLYQATGSYTATFGWLTVVAVMGLALITAARGAAR
jgi:predicted MFS family arabinose efflux permease